MGSKAVVMAPVVSDSEFFSQPMIRTLSNIPEPTRWYPPIATVHPVVPPVVSLIMGFIVPPEPSTLQQST